MEKSGLSFWKLKRTLQQAVLNILFAALLLFVMPCRASAQDSWTSCGDNVYTQHENSQMKIALTFDDGPHPVYTDEILAILREYGIKATFFVIGENVKYQPEIVKRTIEAGHEIGNHTFSHPRLNMKKYPLSKLKSEILDTEELIYEISEYRPKLFRPPEGRCCGAVADMADLLDYEVILWTVDTYDWRHTPPDTIVNNVLSNIRSGDIILCHDGIGKNSPTPEALRIFIPKLLEQGYKFVTVSELLLSN